MKRLPPLSKARQHWIMRLHSKRSRDELRCFIAEGVRVIAELARSNYQPLLLVCTQTLAREQSQLIELFQERGVPCYDASESTIGRLADTTTPQGILAVVAYSTDRTHIPADDSIVALDGIADPGNAGTIVRTALWFGYRYVVFGSGSVDRYHPKFVRATMGALFHLVLIESALDAFIMQYRSTHRVVGAVTRQGISLSRYRCSPSPHILVIGSEAHGISAPVEALLDDRVTIEGSGMFDSLNAAVAAGIVMHHLQQQ